MLCSAQPLCLAFARARRAVAQCPCTGCALRSREVEVRLEARERRESGSKVPPGDHGITIEQASCLRLQQIVRMPYGFRGMGTVTGMQTGECVWSCAS